MSEKSNVLAIIGVGNMAKAIISGIISSKMNISDIVLYDKTETQYKSLPNGSIPYTYANSISNAVSDADYVLLSVKPQNYADVLSEIRDLPDCEKKIYISIGAGITSGSVSASLKNACVIRVLPNVPMLIGMGVSVICRNSSAPEECFSFVRGVFEAAGSVLLIDESEMNRIIGVTSSSPAYVFKFINAIYQGAQAQGLDGNELLGVICDTVIGSALMLKQSDCAPDELIAKVASKGGTTERALYKLDESDFDGIIREAMIACTDRADELGKKK